MTKTVSWTSNSTGGLPPVSLVQNGQIYHHMPNNKIYISDGSQWLEMPKPNSFISTPAMSGAFNVWPSPKDFLKEVEAEWIGENPDGWFPEPYEEERAHLELEAGHEAMREWCEREMS